jgi:hypothetical protein
MASRRPARLAVIEDGQGFSFSGENFSKTARVARRTPARMT